MAWKYNPFTDALDQTGAGGASYIDGVVADSSLLPVTLGTPALDAVYLAKAGSGVWLINRKPAGLYVRVANNGDAADWTYLGAFPEVNSDAHFALYNDTTPSKELKFDLSGISASTVRTLTAPDASGRIQVEGQAIGDTTPAAGTFTTLAASNSGVALTLTDTTTSLNYDNVFEVKRGTSLQFNIRDDGFANSAFGFSQATNILLAGTVFKLRGDATLEWSSTGSVNGATDLVVVRDGANTLAQRRGTNAQTFNLYNTYTSATNYERGVLKWSSNVFQIGTDKGTGGGTARALELQTDGTTRLTLGASALNVLEVPNSTYWTTSGATWMLVANGTDVEIQNLYPRVDNTTVIGATNRRFGGLFSTSLNLDGDIVLQTSTGTKIGTATNQLLGFYGVTPVDQPATVTDPTGGGTQDAEARTAINAIIDRLQELGLIA